MYIREVTIRNVRCLPLLKWKVDYGQECGWHVFIGDNGAGKTTLLRSIALALLGPEHGQALRLNWGDWVASHEKSGTIRVDFVEAPRVDKWAGKGKKVTNFLLTAFVRILRTEGTGRLAAVNKNVFRTDRHAWSDKPGWFSASYGPFRRFMGGNKESEKIFYSDPKVGRHLSLFEEGVALSECLGWLQNLKFKVLEAERDRGAVMAALEPSAKLLEHITAFLNHPGFLPHGAKLEQITSEAVQFIDGRGVCLGVNELSDGYRSILSLSLELIRQLVDAYGVDQVFDRTKKGRVSAPGIVLIDEIDAHLHPTWQMDIGLRLREFFPKIQFLVTTHSPLVCQAAASGGSVFRLAKPGSEMPSEMLTGDRLNRLLYGNVLDAYDSRGFGDDVGRSLLGQQKLGRLAALNEKEIEKGLTQSEKREQQELRRIFPAVGLKGGHKVD